MTRNHPGVTNYILQGFLNTGPCGWILIEVWIKEKKSSSTKPVRQREACYQMLATHLNTALIIVLYQSRTELPTITIKHSYHCIFTLYSTDKGSSLTSFISTQKLWKPFINTVHHIIQEAVLSRCPFYYKRENV